jgi:hypothetical protein
MRKYYVTKLQHQRVKCHSTKRIANLTLLALPTKLQTYCSELPSGMYCSVNAV